MSTTEAFAIVGGGLAGAKAAEELRAGGFEGRLLLLGAEHHRPYERPPLSKGFLAGGQELEKVFVHPPQWYDDNEVELRMGTTATALNGDAHTLVFGNEQVTWDRLLIATGCQPRRLALADDSGAPMAYLRTIEDSQRIRTELLPGHRIAIIGGGWIGLEVASAARAAGCEVVVLEAANLPLVRVLGPEVAEVFAGLHRAHGVDLRTGVTVTDIGEKDGRAVVRLGDGSSVTADLLVVGVGAAPLVGLAEAAGLGTDNGVLVDQYLRTSHPDVFAAGDVANAYHPRLGKRLRVEHWDNAIQQGRLAARNMLGGEEAYEQLPYFFTDQYDLGMEYVGNAGEGEYDQVVLRGDVPGLVFTAFWVANGTVVAGMQVNDWDATDAIRRIVGVPGIDLAALRDARVPLDQVTN